MMKTSIAVLASILLAGCGDVSGKIKAVYDHAGVTDFARSQILVGSPAAADGASEVLVVIQLTNSDGTPVKFFKPSYEILFGTGVVQSPCTTSDINGVSTCIVKATIAGTKRLSVNNIKITLKADVEFIAPGSKPLFELSGAGGTRSAAGFKMSATVGGPTAPVVNTAPGGWTLSGGLEGLKVSR